VRDYRNAVGFYLLPELGATTLLRTIDTRRIDAYRERLLTEGELSGARPRSSPPSAAR
jgi:hypothetical protein